MAENRDQANQDPTPQRLRRAEQSGQFARSSELASALAWLGGFALLITLGSGIWNSISRFADRNWAESDVGLSANEVLASNFAASQSIFWTAVLPVLGGMALIAILANMAQSGFRFFPHLAAPDVSRMSPHHNLSRMFRIEQFVSVALGLVKFIILMVIAAWVLVGDIPSLMGLGRGTIHQNSHAMTDWLVSATLRLGIATIAIGIADYFVRWQLNRRSLRMTDQEIRDEQRSMEASPEVAARRRLLQRR